MSNETVGKKALKAGIGYTIGNVLVKGISFISIPIFARLLTVSDYGIVNTFNAYVSILTIVIGFATHSSIKNAKIDFSKNIKEYISSLTLLTLFNTFILMCIAFVFSEKLAELLSLEVPILVILVVVESFCMTMIKYYNSVLSLEYRYKDYMKLSLFYAVTGMGISIGLIFSFLSSNRWLGRILGTLISAIVVTGMMLRRMYRDAKPHINIEYWKYALKISLPIIPHGLSQIVLAQFDRLMINSVVGSMQAGLYSFAYNVGTIFQVIVNSLDVAWTQWYFDQMEREDYSQIRRVAIVYSGCVSVGVILLMLLSPELIIIMGGNKYRESISVTFPVVLSMYYAFMYYFPASIEYYYKKTSLIAVGTMVAAVINILLNAIFIPRYGYIAAAYTTVVCYIIYYMMHSIFAYKIHGSFIYNMRLQILFMSIVTGSMFVCLWLRNYLMIRWGIVIGCLMAICIICLKKKIKLKEYWLGK